MTDNASGRRSSAASVVHRIALATITVLNAAHLCPLNPSQPPKNSDQESAAWIFGARPAAVIGGGLLLLLLAAALLTIGQRDDTGTIVMLSFCAAPLGLLVLLIGIARYIARATRRG
jgi:di/tricarboxylate transporter